MSLDAFHLTTSTLRASSELPKVTSTVLRCLDTSGCEGHFLDSCLQKAGVAHAQHPEAIKLRKDITERI